MIHSSPPSLTCHHDQLNNGACMLATKISPFARTTRAMLMYSFNPTLMPIATSSPIWVGPWLLRGQRYGPVGSRGRASLARCSMEMYRRLPARQYASISGRESHIGTLRTLISSVGRPLDIMKIRLFVLATLLSSDTFQSECHPHLSPFLSPL